MMDRHFMAIAIIGVIILGAAGLLTGALCGNTAISVACLGVTSTAMGVLGGILAAPKVQPPAPTMSDLINQTIINAANQKGE